MNKPYFTIQIAGKEIDLTEYSCEGFTYEDCLKEDDLISFSLNGGQEIWELDVKEGMPLIAQFGYKDGDSSGKRACFVKDFDYRINGLLVSLSVKALDKGSFLKKRESKKIWKQMSASEIASNIADSYELKKDIQSTSKKYPSLNQGKLTDFKFLSNLAQKEDKFHFRISGDTLIFKPLNLDEQSKIVYSPADGSFLEFSFGFKAAEGDGSDGGVISEGLTTTGSVQQEKPKDATATGQYRVSYDTNGNIKAPAKDKQTAASKYHTSPHDSQTKQAIINNQKRDKELEKVEGTLVVEGNPMLVAGQMITINGIGNTWSGNWLVTKITHNISIGSFYKTTLTVNKNAGKKSSSQTQTSKTSSGQNTNPSQKTASDSSKGKKPVRYDKNGNKV